MILSSFASEHAKVNTRLFDMYRYPRLAQMQMSFANVKCKCQCENFNVHLQACVHGCSVNWCYASLGLPFR